MKKYLLPICIALIVIVIGIVGFTLFKKSPMIPQEEVVVEEQVAVADSSIVADVAWSKVRNNFIVLTISGLKSRYTTLEYEITYDTQGVIQGVITKPLDITGKDNFIRDDIYLGTQSKNTYKPHLGVKKVSTVLLFTDTSGKKSQLTKDFDL